MVGWGVAEMERESTGPTRTAAAWAGTAVAVAALSVALAAAGLQAAPLFAALAVGLVVALVRRGPALVVPPSVAAAGQALLGVLIGALAQPSTLAVLGRDWWAVTLVVGATLALSFAGAAVLARHRGVDAVTATFSLVAGGASGVTAMSADLGADQRVVAVVQYLRVLLVVVSLPFVAAVLPDGDGAGGAGALAAGSSPAAWPVDLAFAVGCVLAGLALARWARIPAATLLWPLGVAVALSVTGLSHGAAVPLPLVDLAYAVIGLGVGLTFTRASVGAVARVLPLATAVLLGLLVAVAAVSVPLLRAVGFSTLDAYLASTPGGLSAVLAVAASRGGDATLVLAVQVLRLLVVVLTAPLVAAVLRRYAGSVRKPDRRGSREHLQRRSLL